MDLDKFLATVRASQLQKCLFHFTDKQNLASIRKHGLLSTAELRRRGLFGDVKAGGDINSQQSDRNKGTDKFVCLCFTASHPMYYRAQSRGIDPVYLQIDPEIVKVAGVMITNAPSNQGGVERVPAAEALNGLDLHVIYNRTA
jgi:ssDNA thymidine ADP-ribosyltransferase, DarT